MKVSGHVVAVTLNPAIDRIIVLDDLRKGTKNIALETRVFAGGKGVNVARALAGLGVPAIATGFLGRSELETYTRELESVGARASFIVMDAPTRNNYKLITGSTGADTEVNEQGFTINNGDLDRLSAQLDELLASASMLTLSGSAPLGAPAEIYARLIRQARSKGVPSALDTSSAMLAPGVAAAPYLLRVNRFELEELNGRSLPTTKDVIEALKAICHGYVHLAIASLGAEGSIGSDGTESWIARPPVVSAKSPTGAGDVMLAGMVQALRDSLPLRKALRWATALATASVLSYEPGTVDLDQARHIARQIELHPAP